MNVTRKFFKFMAKIVRVRSSMLEGMLHGCYIDDLILREGTKVRYRSRFVDR